MNRTLIVCLASLSSFAIACSSSSSGGGTPDPTGAGGISAGGTSAGGSTGATGGAAGTGTGGSSKGVGGTDAGGASAGGASTSAGGASGGGASAGGASGKAGAGGGAGGGAAGSSSGECAVGAPIDSCQYTAAGAPFECLQGYVVSGKPACSGMDQVYSMGACPTPPDTVGHCVKLDAGGKNPSYVLYYYPASGTAAQAMLDCSGKGATFCAGPLVELAR